MNSETINAGLEELDKELTGAIAVVRDFAQKTKSQFAWSRVALDTLPVGLTHLDTVTKMTERIDRAIRLLDHLEDLA